MKAHTMSNTRKVRKTYTISPQSAAFLETLRRQRRAASTSSVIEEILQALRSKQKRRALDAAVKEYYDSLTAEEELELQEWGEFASAQLAKRSE